ncbi:MAG: hypothetical protein ACK5PW_15765 [Burkholderiales bacterium]|jgi:hypothetical protein
MSARSVLKSFACLLSPIFILTGCAERQACFAAIFLMYPLCPEVPNQKSISISAVPEAAKCFYSLTDRGRTAAEDKVLRSKEFAVPFNIDLDDKFSNGFVISCRAEGYANVELIVRNRYVDGGSVKFSSSPSRPMVFEKEFRIFMPRSGVLQDSGFYKAYSKDLQTVFGYGQFDDDDLRKLKEIVLRMLKYENSSGKEQITISADGINTGLSVEGLRRLALHSDFQALSPAKGNR